jgi:thiol:disulfide interchange protein
LQGVIEPKRFVGWFEVNHKPYQGDIDDVHFEVVRFIRYSNPSLPIISGKIQSDGGGCSVHITMCPIGIFLAFIIFWLGTIIYLLLRVLVSLVSSALQGNIQDPSIIFGLVIMFALGYTFSVGLFKFESIQAKEFFRELLQAESIEEMGIANPFKRAG